MIDEALNFFESPRSFYENKKEETWSDIFDLEDIRKRKKEEKNFLKKKKKKSKI